MPGHYNTGEDYLDHEKKKKKKKKKKSSSSIFIDKKMKNPWAR